MNQHELNIEIQRFVADKDNRRESYTDKDIEYIQQYEGSGGQGSKGATGEGVLYEFFTPDFVVELMWKLANQYGYDGGTVLEPSIATGRLIKYAPDKSKCVGFEINETSARISEISYPKATIHRGYFETAFLQGPRFTSLIDKSKVTWLKEYPFSMVIGNPPYGVHKNYYSSYFKSPKLAKIEHYFFYYGMKLLKQNGLLVYLTSSDFMRNGITYEIAKNEIGKIAEFIDAYRLPKVFKSSDVPTDILIFKKK